MLNKKQKKCIEMMLFGDLTQKEIAAEIKVSEQTISHWKKHVPEFMKEYESALREGIREAAAKAFRTQVELLSSKNPMTRHMAAKDILDRAGFKADEKVTVNGSVPVQIVDDLE